MQVLLLAAAVRLLVATLVPLHPDEAYYWEWSRHLAAGYFDHPPVIAWFIRVGTVLLGDTPLGVRFLPVLAGLVAGWAVMRTAARLAGDGAGDAAAVAFVALPVMSGVFVLATPDAPLLAFAALTLWSVTAAEEAPASTGRLAWWLGAGLGAGLAMASKYTGIILPVALFVGLLASRPLRSTLGTPGPWLAAVTSFLVFLPVLRWNALHEWSSFRFQFGHGLGGSIDAGAWQRELELLGGQLLLASPVLFVLGMAALERALRSDDRVAKLLATVAIVTGILFACSALRRRVEANWPALAWVPIACLLGTTSFAGSPPRWRRMAVGLGFLFTAVLYLQSLVPIFPLAAPRDPTARAFGWADLAAAVSQRAEADGKRPWVAANRYQDAAELAFNLPGQPEVFSLNLGGRDNQYRYWAGFPDRARAGDDLLLVLADRPDGATDPAVTALSGSFGSIEQVRVVDMNRGTAKVSARRLWLLRGWNGVWPSPRAH
jgi:4-amino-4-deoxy-L-arabinose transferase-like glycosyltransferase